jgi:hypothetical protein
MFSKAIIFVYNILCLTNYLTVVNAATYQSLYSKCQQNQAGCVVLNFVSGYNQAYQALTRGELIDCANGGSANQICAYASGSGVKISCSNSDDITASINGNKVYATLNGNAAQNFDTSGSGTNIFVAKCLTK